MIRRLNLYKVSSDKLHNAVYSAANNQVEAVTHLLMDYDLESWKCSVVYVGEVYVNEKDNNEQK